MLACGRRWGKTDACAVSILAALLSETPSRHLILAPTLDQAALLFDRVAELLDKVLEGTEETFSVRNRGARKRTEEGSLCFAGPATRPNAVTFAKKEPGEEGGRKKLSRSPFPKLKFGPHVVTARSGHLGRALRGNEATHILIDEAAYVPKSLITEVAMPMLATTDGRLTLISTPRGKNHFWRLFTMGTETPCLSHVDSALGDEKVDWRTVVWSRQAPSWESPHVSKTFLQVQRSLISERAFRVEYGAEFLDAIGAVFPAEAIERCLVAKLPETPSGATVLGIDFARHTDYTAVAVVAGSRKGAALLSIDRFTGISWLEQMERIVRIACAYPEAWLCCDGTGVGDPVIEVLRSRLPGRRIEGFVFTGASKSSLIDRLVLTLEQGALLMEPQPDLLREFEHFVATPSDSGGSRTGAESGFHDDLVIALALAVHLLPPGESCRVSVGPRRAFGRG